MQNRPDAAMGIPTPEWEVTPNSQWVRRSQRTQQQANIPDGRQRTSKVAERRDHERRSWIKPSNISLLRPQAPRAPASEGGIPTVNNNSIRSAADINRQKPSFRNVFGRRAGQTNTQTHHTPPNNMNSRIKSQTYEYETRRAYAALRPARARSRPRVVPPMPLETTPHRLHNMRRASSDRYPTDYPSADDLDFQLFAEATTGLELEHMLRPPSSSTANHRQGRDTGRLEYRRSAPELTSPTDITQNSLVSPLSIFNGRENLNSSHSMWSEISPLSTMEPDPWMSRFIVGDTSTNNEYAEWNAFFGTENFEHYDEELPGYAESQAQAAAAHQRVEAARRAQELQRRWQLAGSLRGV